MKKYCLLLFVLAFVACTNESPPIIQDAEVLSDVAMVRIFDNTMSQSDLIRNVAEQFDIKQAVTRSEKEQRAIKEIIPINGKDGEPAMYVVNYADNKGWVIVSGTTDYAPILAHNDEGNFDVSHIEGNGIEVWMDETESTIEYMKTAPEEEKKKYQSQWMYYASKSVPLTDVVPMTRDDASEALAYQNQCCAQWEAEGYDVYLLIGFAGSQPSYVSNSLLNQIYSDAYTYGTNQYDGVLYNSLVLTTKEIVEEHPALTQTKWKQGSPYNDSIPNHFYNIYGIPYYYYENDTLKNFYVGCGPLAVAQIMRYHEYPTTFNWNNMPNTATPSTMTSDLASFLKEIHLSAVTGYNLNTGESSSTIPSILNTLHNYGYEAASSISHNINTVESEIDNNRPVLMSGYKTNSGGGHAWLCDGYYVRTLYHEVILKTMQTKSSFYTVNYGYYGTNSTENYFYMVWGLDDKGDGSYLDSNSTFNYNRQDIINIYPTNS